MNPYKMTNYEIYWLANSARRTTDPFQPFCLVAKKAAVNNIFKRQCQKSIGPNLWPAGITLNMPQPRVYLLQINQHWVVSLAKMHLTLHVISRT